MLFSNRLINLSLRFCKITDANAQRLAHQLGNMSTQNWKLLTLTLTGNQIGDNGAKSFAQVTRFLLRFHLNFSSPGVTLQSNIDLAESLFEFHHR